MKTVLWKRTILAGLRGFYRNRTVSLSSIFILTITLSIITSFYLFRAVFDYTLDQVKEKVDVRVYFTTDATEQQVTDIKAKLLGLSDVKMVTYTSRDQALADFKKKHTNCKVILQGL